ncbi:PhzF family phenazine biosynthesis protein [Parasphingopyxis sp.]|uniref:PhzF family phenazine biosynthesis protein n=1 Tax=Parasphingopyxis sp. TaxID=1920299 RepID=UPI00261A0822|nr:PhzF family phenazine biosynthesis protein [Parasphingopyxis sp.]
MPTLRLVQIDAFSKTAFGGNPAAVMPLESWLEDDILQAIAVENNLSETAFYLPAKDDPEADFELRWFTPGLEIALCGHATLATGAHILREGWARNSVIFRTRKAGLLEVRRNGEGFEVSLPAYPPAPKALPEAVAALDAEPLETHFHEGRYSLYLYENEDQVRALAPDMRALAAIGDWQFIATAPGSETDVVSRVFVPGAGVDEDPVTGSAHAVLTPFWAERLGRDRFTAFQASARGGHVGCRLDGDRAVLSGHCATVIEGEFFF